MTVPDRAPTVPGTLTVHALIAALEARTAYRGDPLRIVAPGDPARLANLHPDWHRHAACAGLDVEMFFPRPGQSTEQARAVCSSCPVSAECLAEAMADSSLDFGIRGGLSARQRQMMRREAGR